MGWLFILIALASGCTDRQHRNPLDPLTTEAAEEVQALRAVAGDGWVRLSWDFSQFDDISGYRLYRRLAGGDFALYQEQPLAPQTREVRDERVENGATYEYQLALLVEGEGERRLAEIRRATPGAQVGWAGDPSTGIVWRISPDGRSEHFSQGRFPGLVGLAVDARDHACWVSDRFFKGVFRLDPADPLRFASYGAALGEAGPLSLDTAADKGWVIDAERQVVYWFSLAASADTLALNPVDAHFTQLTSLAAQGGSCWIADGGRVVRYWPEGKRQEWRTGPVRRLAAGAGEVGWALAQDGKRLVRLAADGEALVLSLPFAEGQALAVEGQRCWVLGTGDLAIFDAAGVLQAHWEGLSGGRDLAVDPRHREVWIATAGALLKTDTQGSELARLNGFVELAFIAVNPERN